MIKNKKLTFALIIYTILLFGVWTLYELSFKETLSQHFDSVYIAEIVKTVIKLTIWAVPAFILINIFNKNMYIRLPNMVKNKFTSKWWLLIIVMIAYFSISSYRRCGMVKLSDNILWERLIPYIFVGVSEEMVFRGWLLNATMKDSDKLILPVAVNAVMFTLIHFPIWYHTGVLMQYLTSFSFLQIAGLSVLFSWTFIRSRNIAVPIIMHSVYDILVLLFFGT